MNDNVIGIENTKSEKDNYLCPSWNYVFVFVLFWFFSLFKYIVDQFYAVTP